MKQCSKCKIRKLVSEFRADSRNVCGLQSWCRVCQNRLNQEYKRTANGRSANLKYQRSARGKNTYKLWTQSEQGRVACQQYTRQRRERKLGLDMRLTKSDIDYIYESFDNKCFNCKTNKGLVVDHHYPLSRGYGLTLQNAVLLCKSCNSSKHDKMPEDFYSKKQLLILARKTNNDQQ